MKKFKCKVCRRLGQSVCSRAKCAILRKPYSPGLQPKRGKKSLSEYGLQLREKQKLKNLYGLKEKQFERYITAAFSKLKQGKEIEYALISSLEHRLDNIVFRLGFASTRFQARQLVSHGHFYVNEQKIDIPSYEVKKGDVIKVSSFKENKIIHKNSSSHLKGFSPLSWLEVDPKKMAGTVKADISVDEIKLPVDISKVFAFYSKKL